MPGARRSQSAAFFGFGIVQPAGASAVPHFGVQPPLSSFFASLLYWSIDSASLWGVPKRFYELRPLRVIGWSSYGIYILHLPLARLSEHVLVRWGWFDPKGGSWLAAFAMIALNVALTAAAAVASFHLLEKRFLRLKRYFPEPSGVSAGAGS